MSGKIATIRSPLFQAITRGMFQFPDLAAAKAKLEAIRETYETSSHLPSAKAGHVVLWIKGYDVSPEEAEAGYLGHYAELQPIEREDGGLVDCGQAAGRGTYAASAKATGGASASRLGASDS